jgi:hypothetical protein
MNRKKWTALTEVTDTLLKLREKRKWQIALRRYVLEQKWSAFYAPYFGIDISQFREWIALQFETNNDWDTFSKTWQFDHVVPVAYFDFGSASDLMLCWNFTNIRVAQTAPGAPGIDLVGAAAYFEALHTRTGYSACREMFWKMEALKKAQLGDLGKQAAFLEERMPYLQSIADFGEYEYTQLNEGVPLERIREERAFSVKVHGNNP